MTRYVTLDDAIALGTRVLAVEGHRFLVRDVGLLQSALNRPQTTVFGEDAYPSVVQKAAALIESLARDRALVDGNRRMAWAGTKLFLALNDEWLTAPSVDEGETFVLAVAQGALTLAETAATLQAWSVAGD